MDTAAILRVRPAGQDRDALRNAFARLADERQKGAARLAALLDQRRRIVLTGTADELVNNARAVQDAQITVEMLDAAFVALAERDRNIAAGA